MSLRVYLGLAATAAIFGLLAFAASEHTGREAAERRVRDHAACVKAIGQGPAGGLVVSQTCDVAIAEVVSTVRQAERCDASLQSRPENVYGVAAACSAPVKHLHAERDGARGDAANLTILLDQVRKDQAGVVTRAVSAARSEAERKARANAALQNAPRDGDGLVVCDAQCMQDRWSDASAGSGR